MRKKNVLVMGLSMALVAVISIGSTLAYLTASDDKVVNTFEFANDMAVTLSEDAPTAVEKETITSNQQGGYQYANVVPGQTLNKAPKFTVTTSVDAYVFARVDVGENMALGAITDGWNELEGADNVWYKEVSGQAGVQDLGTLFTTVTVGDVDLEGTEDLGDITIEVAAIQSAGFSNAAAAYAEAEFQA